MSSRTLLSDHYFAFFAAISPLFCATRRDFSLKEEFNRFVEDDTSTFAVILDVDQEYYEPSFPLLRKDSADSTINFPIRVNVINVEITDDSLTDVPLLHYENAEPLPVYSVDERPLDGPSTLNNTIKCPLRYICKTPPSMVTENYSFVCDGDEVSPDEVLADQRWWKQTSCSTRFYSSDNLTTFYQVTLLTCRGEMRGAYRSRSKGAGIIQVALERVFRVSRYFSYWKTCPSFHRIVSVINPVNEEGERLHNFRKRLFIQFFWRSEKAHERETVKSECASTRDSPRHSLLPPSSRNLLRSHYPSLSTSSQSSNDSLLSSSPRRGMARFRAVATSIKNNNVFLRKTSTAATPKTFTKRYSVDGW